MAKKREPEYEQIIDNTKYVDLPVEREMKKSFISYAMAVNVSRAIPDVRDGLKPVHRRILYAMSELGLEHNKPFKKCARIVGDVLGKYHPHGDSSVYDALVRMAQKFSIRELLVDGHGNFGSVDGDPPAAYRYTEARLSKISGEMLRDIEKNTVDFYPNFDETLTQPSVLPSRYPNILVNGSDGIAVGMATSIPPHNLSEVIDSTVALLDNPEADVEELMKYIPAPDFPTAALVMGRAAIRQAYKTGRGGCVLRARTDIEELHNGRHRIVVTELPYQVNKARLIETIAELVKERRIEGISDVKEESDRKGMRIVIDVKRDANAQVVLNQLFKQTNMQTSHSIILLALKEGTPRIMNLKEILSAYIAHQIEVIERRTRYDLEKAQERAHIVEGLCIALANIDEVIKIIKESSDRHEAAEKLIATFLLSEKQANAILEMRLHRLTSLEVEKLQKELEELHEFIAECKSILETPEKVIGILKDELLEIKDKFGGPRRSEICYDYEEINIADLIEKEDVVVSMTHFGYIKRISLDEYRSQRRGGRGLTAHKAKEEDFIADMFITNTHDDLFFFTNKGKVYSLKGYDIPEADRTARGRAIVNLLQLDSGERVTAFMPIKADIMGKKLKAQEMEDVEGQPQEQEGMEGQAVDNNEVDTKIDAADTDEQAVSAVEKDGGARYYLMLATARGMIKKTAVEEFSRIRKSGKVAISLNHGDELISAQLTSGDNEIIMASQSGKCIRFSEKNVRSMGREAMGVKSMRLSADDNVVDMSVMREGYDLLTISESGFGKRSSPEDYRLQGRAGSGIKAGIFNDKTGQLICLKQVRPEDDLMIIADTGIIIRIKASGISRIGRDTMGVRLMSIKGDGKVVSVAVAAGAEVDAQIAAEEDIADVALDVVKEQETANEELQADTQTVDEMGQAETIDEQQSEAVDDKQAETQIVDEAEQVDQAQADNADEQMVTQESRTDDDAENDEIDDVFESIVDFVEGEDDLSAD